MREKLTNIALPKGEWLEAMLLALKVAGLEITTAPRSYEYTFVNQALPILFQAIRSKEVVTAVYDWDTRNLNAGFTGTDIAQEKNINISGGRSWIFPLLELNPQAPQPKVYIGSTPNLRAQVKQPTMQDLQATTIYTEYPTLTQQVLMKGGVTAKVKPVQGGSEAWWRLDPRNGAILTIRNTDATMKANEISLIEDIMTPEVVYIESANASTQDRVRVDDFRELIYQALKGKAK